MPPYCRRSGDQNQQIGYQKSKYTGPVTACKLLHFVENDLKTDVTKCGRNTAGQEQHKNKLTIDEYHNLTC